MQRDLEFVIPHRSNLFKATLIMRGRMLLFLSVLILVFLGWMFPEWELASIPYYTETAAEIHKVQGVLIQLYDSFLKQPYGVWLLEHIQMIGGGYALVALFMVAISKKDRSSGWGNLRFLCIATLALIVWFFVGTWASVACGDIYRTYDSVYPFKYGSSWLLSWIAGLLAALIVLALGFTFWVGIPIYFVCVLLLLPDALYALLRGAILLPFLTWHYLHYLFVPHPAEGVFLKHEQMRMERGVKIDRAALGEELSRVMYNMEREGLPAWWKSENWTRRLKDLRALRGRVEVEKDLVDDETEDIRERNRRER